MNTPIIHIQPCDIAVEGRVGRRIKKSLGERLIRYGTRTGYLGITAGPLLVVLNLIIGLFWTYPGIGWVTGALALWILVSALRLEGRTVWDHALIYVKGGILAHSAEAVEAYVKKGMTRTRPTSVPDNCKIFRPKNLTAGQKAAVIARLESRLGLPCSMRALVMFGLDYIAGLGLLDVFFFRKHFLSPEDLVCSYYAAVGLWEVMNHVTGYNFGVDHWQMISPDTIADFCSTHPEFYDLVAEKKDGEWKLVPLMGAA